MHNPKLKVIDGTIYADSLEMAKQFKKRHDVIMRLIRNTKNRLSFCNFAERDEFLSVGFVLTDYSNSRGQKFPCYNLTRDAFDFVAFGLTGKEADEHKLAYIFEFRRMERELRQAHNKIAELKQMEMFPDQLREPEFTIAEVLEKLALLGLFNSRTTANSIKSKIKRGAINGRFDGHRYVVPESALKQFIKRRELSA